MSTTNYPFRIGQRQQRRGLVSSTRKVVDTFVFGQVRTSVGAATCLLRDRTQSPPVDRFPRIDYIARPALFRFNDAQAVQKLMEIGSGVAAHFAIAEMVKNSFLNGQSAEPFRHV